MKNYLKVFWLGMLFTFLILTGCGGGTNNGGGHNDMSVAKIIINLTGNKNLFSGIKAELVKTTGEVVNSHVFIGGETSWTFLEKPPAGTNVPAKIRITYSNGVISEGDNFEYYLGYVYTMSVNIS